MGRNMRAVWVILPRDYPFRATYWLLGPPAKRSESGKVADLAFRDEYGVVCSTVLNR